MLLCFSPSYKVFSYSCIPTCLLHGASHLFISSCFILSIQSPLTFLRSHLMLFSGPKDCPSLPSTGQTFYPLRRFWIFRQQLALQAWESRGAQIPQEALCAMGLCSVACHAFLIMLAVLLWIKSSRREGCVWDMETYFISSSASWFSSACPASPAPSRPSDHLPFPPCFHQGPVQSAGEADSG